MKKRERILTIVITACVVLLIVGVTAIAAGTFGSQSDPLVTLSYINQTVEPEVRSYAEEKVAEASTQISRDVDAKLNEYSASVEDKLSGSAVYEDGDVFVTLELTDGEAVTCPVGTELMVRQGTVRTGSGFKASDTSNGTESGATLSINHMYVVTESGSITASGSVTLLIRGDYSL
jgi:hypothetical protein